jgi:predicted signal transduction protein with EAL and GGDEF domain
MREPKALSMPLAIDAFGTGYALLSYLRLYAFDVIKIDRQFIHDHDVIARDRAFVQAIPDDFLALGRGFEALAIGLDAMDGPRDVSAHYQMLRTGHDPLAYHKHILQRLPK